MTLEDMVDLLGLRLEDAEEKKFTAGFKIQALNNAQIKLANMLLNPYLTELQVLATSQTATTGVLGIDDILAYDVLRGSEGILNVKISSGKYFHKIDLTDLKKTENSFLAAATDNPLYYVFQNRLYVLPTAITTVDVLYLKIPAHFVNSFTCNEASAAAKTAFTGDDDQNLSAVDDHYNNTVVWSDEYSSYHVVTDYTGASRTFTVEPEATGNFGDSTFKFVTDGFEELRTSEVTSDLNSSLHELVVTLAEAEAWAMDRDQERRTTAQSAVLDEVRALNSAYRKADGIGTKGDERTNVQA